MPLVLVVLLTSLHTPISFAGVRTAGSGTAVSVWSSLTTKIAGAYSSVAERPIQDCLRPKPVDCFSIQQNSWISDSTGNFVLWAQNVVELAKLDSATYYGTFTFQVWSPVTGRAPALCKPESSRTTSCRAPFYTTRVPLPQSFTFYSHISNQGTKQVLQMSNSLGAVNWEIPGFVSCPCHIETFPGSPLPWGRSPFELVAVGLDSSAVAFFRNGTLGRFGPVLVESEDGFWHNASTTTLSCLTLANCYGQTATAEKSMNLAWNSTTGEFHWSQGATDEGVSISGLSGGVVASPELPDPREETYLYAEFRSVYAYLTILDGKERALGVDLQSGKPVVDIPNSSMTHNSSEELLIINPIGEYELIITAGGNTQFRLFLSKTSNTGSELGTRSYNGTLNIGYSTSLHLDADKMSLSSEQSVSTAYLLPVAGIVLALVGFIGVITAILIFRRRHAED